MASDNETLADIVAAMRCDAKLCSDAWLKDPKENPQADCIGIFLNSYARRIEAAWKRERESYVNSGSAVYTGDNKVGNAAAMREALLALSAWVKIVKDHPKDKTAMECAEFVEQAVNAALAIPRRQCDVGTAEEQSRRYEHYCFTHRTMERCCQDCPIKDEPCCELAWAQMPYAEGGAK